MLMLIKTAGIIQRVRIGFLFSSSIQTSRPIAADQKMLNSTSSRHTHDNRSICINIMGNITIV